MLLFAVHESTIANAHPKPIPALAAVWECRFSIDLLMYLDSPEYRQYWQLFGRDSTGPSID
jgi:hypothetical protein